MFYFIRPRLFPPGIAGDVSRGSRPPDGLRQAAGAARVQGAGLFQQGQRAAGAGDVSRGSRPPDGSRQAAGAARVQGAGLFQQGQQAAGAVSISTGGRGAERRGSAGGIALTHMRGNIKRACARCPSKKFFIPRRGIPGPKNRGVSARAVFLCYAFHVARQAARRGRRKMPRKKFLKRGLTNGVHRDTIPNVDGVHRTQHDENRRPTP